MIFLSLGILCSVAVGALCAPLRRGVHVTLAVSALMFAGATVGGVIFHDHLWMVVAQSFGFIIALQCTYVAVGLMIQYFRLRALIPQMSASIGQNLKTELEIPRSLPLELSLLVAQL
jgi:hypothetical protein